MTRTTPISTWSRRFWPTSGPAADLDPAWVVAEPVVTFADLARAMAPASLIVASRYHNVICALMLSKPTISIGYAEKNAVLMAGTAWPSTVSRSAPWTWTSSSSSSRNSKTHAARLRQAIAEGNAAKAPLVQAQLAELSAALFPAAEPVTPAGREGTRQS